MILSLGVNTLLFILGSLFSFPSPLERLQGAQFVNVYDHSTALLGWRGAVGTADDLLIMAQRILGPARAGRLFQDARWRRGGAVTCRSPRRISSKGWSGSLPVRSGRRRRMRWSRRSPGGPASRCATCLAVADETAQIMEYSSQLEAKSAELSQTAARLREVNQKLTQLSVQKDAFLSQISHELRTPMTSIRSFSEILMQADPVDDAARTRFSRIIHDESLRLTRLLDDLLDLSVLENGMVTLNRGEAELGDVLDRAIYAAGALEEGGRIAIRRDRAAERVTLVTDPDRLTQVFINLISNAQKYCDAEAPELRIDVTAGPGRWRSSSPTTARASRRQQSLIFEKFARLETAKGAPGAGLGLAISREIMGRLGGSLTYQPGRAGTRFVVVRLPLGLPDTAPARSVAE
jgi:signal transduction histidine kinase